MGLTSEVLMRQVDNGEPVCYDNQTCLFSTVGTSRYEGCGHSGVDYDWITGIYPCSFLCFTFPT